MLLIKPSARLDPDKIVFKCISGVPVIHWWFEQKVSGRTPSHFHIKVFLLQVLKSLCEGFFGFRGSCVKSDNVPQVMSPESEPVRAEDYKFENEKKSVGVVLQRSEVTRPL